MKHVSPMDLSHPNKRNKIGFPSETHRFSVKTHGMAVKTPTRLPTHQSFSSIHVSNMSVYLCIHPIISYHITSYHVISYYVISHHIISYHVISHHITSYHIMSYHITSYHMSYHITSYHIMSYHITSYHVILYHIISYHIMSYHIISCHITSYHINPSIYQSISLPSVSRFIPSYPIYFTRSPADCHRWLGHADLRHGELPLQRKEVLEITGSTGTAPPRLAGGGLKGSQKESRSGKTMLSQDGLRFPNGCSLGNSKMEKQTSSTHCASCSSRSAPTGSLQMH